MDFNKDILNNIVLGDFKEIVKFIPDNSIDMVISDPPYIRKELYTYDYLSEYCPRIMKKGASLLTIVGHFALPYIIKKFDGKLKYRWIMNLDQTNGKHARMAMGIEVLWKPVLWYVKDVYPMGRGFIRDKVDITGKDGQNKYRYKWEQDMSWCYYFIKKLTKPGDIVLDPYVGAGATMEACKLLGINYIGIDINEECVNICKNRLMNLRNNYAI